MLSSQNILNQRKHRKCASILFQLLFLLSVCNTGDSQTFIRTCQDPLITQLHIQNFGHTFCYHSCGYDLGAQPPVGLEVCTPNGICQCNFACDTPPPAILYGSQCPALPSDPPDNDPNAMSNCLRDCAGLCPGGQGQICGEVYQQPIPGTVDTYGKVCTCYCPPQPCNPPTTTTTTPATTTTTPATTTAVSVAVVKNPFPLLLLLKVKKKVVKVLIVLKVCVFLLKLCAVYWLKFLLICVYCYLVQQWISPILSKVFTLWEINEWVAFT